MLREYIAMEKLAGPDGDGCGPYCNDSGLFIGPGIALVARDLDEPGAPFRPQPQAEIDRLLTLAYGTAFDSTSKWGGFEAVSKALNAADITRAVIAALHLRLEPLPAGAQDRLAKYSPDQPRDWHGRWTSEENSGTNQLQADAGSSATAQPGSPQVPGTSDEAPAVAGTLLDMCIELCWRLLERRQTAGSGKNEAAFRRCLADCKLKLGGVG